MPTSPLKTARVLKDMASTKDKRNTAKINTNMKAERTPSGGTACCQNKYRKVAYQRQAPLSSMLAHLSPKCAMHAAYLKFVLMNN